MKATDTPKIDQAWWNKNKPGTLKSTGLGKAMARYQDDKAEAKKLAAKEPMDYGSALAGYTTAEASFQELSSSARKALAACNKTLHADCIVVLNKLIKSVLPAENTALGAAKQSFIDDAKAEAARVKGLGKNLLALATATSDSAVKRLGDVSKLEDELADLRDQAGKALQSKTPFAPKQVDAARVAADAINAALTTTETELAQARQTVRKKLDEVFHRGLEPVDPALPRLRDSIAMPLDVIEAKALPRLEEAAERAKKALKSIEDLASGAADVRQEYLGILNDFVQRGIQRGDAVTGNIRTAGGKLDRAGQEILSFTEIKDGPRDKTLITNATKLLTEGVKEISMTKPVLEAFERSLDEFTGKLPPFVEPKSSTFREPIGELLKLSQGASEDRKELEKLTAKATKINAELKKAMALPV